MPFLGLGTWTYLFYAGESVDVFLEYLVLVGALIAVIVSYLLSRRLIVNEKSMTSLARSGAENYVLVSGSKVGDPGEHIFYRKVGRGKKLLVFLSGNNTSSTVFDGVLNQFRASVFLNDCYTVIAADYRGSGKSSYNTPISALRDFAMDMDKTLLSFNDIHDYEISLVAYSMGFPVAMEMVDMAPERYQSVVGFAPVGTRGIRAEFNSENEGIDNKGRCWEAGDWVPINDATKGIEITAFHQRAWQGVQRSFLSVKNTWDAIVFNDSLQFDLHKNRPTYPGMIDAACYTNTLSDCLDIQYMPESLFYAHTFNGSGVELSLNRNSDGTDVSIQTDNKIDAFSHKNVLLVKAHMNIVEWRGDLVIDDASFWHSHDDLNSAGANVTSILIDANHGFDHGMVIVHPEKITALLMTYFSGALVEQKASSILGAPIVYKN